MISRYSVLANGRVQGVGFRFFVNNEAIRHGLTGWVKNLDDGSVIMEVQGPASRIEAFLYVVERGNRFIRVDGLTRKKLPPTIGEASFRILG